MDEKKNEEWEGFVCPVGKFFHELGKGMVKRSDFHKHLSRSRIEFLKAIRSLVDERIETLEGKGPEPEHKVTKIEVE
jgi:hypothetical protein